MDNDKKYKTPQGTVALVILYVLLIIALWGSAYLTMLARGVTG
ncbi:cytochrome c oxidase subunit 2A [Candidatus Leptofilum sp.]